MDPWHLPSKKCLVYYSFQAPLQTFADTLAERSIANTRSTAADNIKGSASISLHSLVPRQLGLHSLATPPLVLDRKVLKVSTVCIVVQTDADLRLLSFLFSVHSYFIRLDLLLFDNLYRYSAFCLSPLCSLPPIAA